MSDVFKNVAGANFLVNKESKKVIVLNPVPRWIAWLLGEGLDYKVQDPITTFSIEDAYEAETVILVEDNGAALATPLDIETLDPVTGPNGETL